MASRVNVKFVVILSAALTLVCGVVAYVGISIVLKSGDDLVRMGDAKLKEAESAESAGNNALAQEAYGASAFLYSKAVAKDRSNVEFLDRWATALSRWTPDTQTAYRSAFERSMAIKRQRAILLRTNLEAYHDYLGTLERQILLGELSRQSLDYLISETAAALQYFENDAGDALRRYRGRALVEIMDSNLELTEQQREQARADLLSALKVEPTNATAAVALARWGRAESKRVAALGEAARAAEIEREAVGTLRSFVEQNRTNTTGLLGLLTIDTEVALSGAGSQESARRALLASLRPRLDAVREAMMADDPAKLDILTIARFRLLESLLDPESGSESTREILARAIAANPTDPDLLAMNARLSFDLRQFARAIDEYQAVADLKPRPVSLEGMRRYLRRVEAISQQAESVLGMWEQTTGAEERTALVERANKYRQALAAELPTDAPALLLLDAKIAIASGRESDAQRLLFTYNERTLSNDVQGVWLLGQVTMRTQPGIARRQFERVLQMQPGNAAAMIALASMESQLQNHTRAIELYRQALAINPGNEQAQRGLDTSLIATNQKSSDDPVIQIIIDARRTEAGTMENPGDPAGAVAMLERGVVEHDLDLRLVSELVRLYLDREEVAKARQLVSQASARHPQHDSLTRLQNALSKGDPVEAAIDLIDSSDLAPATKELSKYRLYRSRGRTADATRAIAAAQRLAPDDAGVIEIAFNDALESRDVERAKSIVERATRLDTDRVGGLTYRARVEMLEGKTAESARTLQQAINAGAPSVGIHRLLGRQLVNLGREQEGFASYRRALEMRPDDVQTINELIAVLVRSNRLQEALAVARDSEKYARTDRTFQNLWMDLEAAVGDKALALSRRMRMVELDPENRENRVALAAILIETARWAEARKVIDDLRSTGDSLQLVELDAKWHADQNDVDGARGVFVGYITEQDPATLTSEPYIVFGRFMLNRRLNDVGIAALNQARTRQDPKVMEADKELADSLFRLQQFADASALYKGVLDANADSPEQLYRLRYIETLLRLQQWDSAESLVAGFGDRVENDPVVLMLRADIAKGRGDMRRCREILDRAVAVAPEDALVYVERAQARAQDPLLVGQAMQDLDRALQLRPSLWQALRIRAAIRAQQGDIEGALADLRSAVTANPALNELRYGLMLELLNRGRSTDAAEVAEQGLSQRPGDLMLMLGTGQIFAERGQWPRAAVFYRRAWMQAQDVATAQLYVESLLNMTPPDLTEATNVLNRMGERVANDPSLILARAEILAKRNRLDDARRELTASYTNVRNEPRQIMAWYAAARRILTRPGELASYLELLEREIPDPWVTYLRGRTLAESSATLSQGVELLRRVQGTNNVALGVNAFRSEGGSYYALDRYEEAVEAWKRGIQKYADDWEMNNNLGFVLAKKLGRAAEAVPFAEHAARMNPNVAEIQDTLGVAYTMTKQFDKADAALQKAMSLSRAASESQITIMVHQGVLDHAMGNMESARTRAKSADDLLRAMPTENPSIRAEVDALLRLVQ
ncbi:MAG: tetratricopeptide repeat protein [Phycisphaeraceae bacterium]|nr:MAG: tetratricopeptide repeat protein [Phycisphaeraceae bacterium]